MQLQFKEEPSVPVRIGIHSGMVTFEGEKVYGDSVNLASRIESMGVPGSVLISKRVRDEIKNNPEILLTDLGSFDFKNVDEALKVYALGNDALVIPSKKELVGKFREKPGFLSRQWTPWILLSCLAAILIIGYYAFQNRAITETDSPFAEKSIAILPFRDLSPDRDQEYFADGIVEAIRSKIAMVGDLRVTSMTSVLPYRDNPKAIAEIARELNVDHILEGTVYRDENKVRIIAQLIEAKTDNHIWVSTYDEEIHDIFSIQTRIANEVARGLQASLTPLEKERLKIEIATDIKAYDLYLSAQNDQRRFNETRDTTFLNKAEEKLNRALTIDSEYDELYFGKAFVWFSRSFMGLGESSLDSSIFFIEKTLAINPENASAYSLLGDIYWHLGEFEKARDASESALQISPNEIPAINTLADYYTSYSEQVEEAIPYLLKAIVLSPVNSNNPEDNSAIYSRIGYLYMVTNQPKQAEEAYRKRYELFPENRNAVGNMRMVYGFTGRNDEALKYSKELVQISPNYLSSLDAYANDLARLGRFEEALKVFEEMKSIVDNNYDETASTRSFRHRYAYTLWQLGRKEEARKMFDEHEKIMLQYIADGTKVQGQEYDLAGIYAFTGRKEKAYEMLDRLPFWFVSNYLIKVDPLFDPIRNEERFQNVIAKIDQKAARMRNKLSEYESDGQLAISPI